MTTFLNSLRAILLVVLLAVSEAHAAPGDADSAYLGVIGSYVEATAVQPDGKTIIAGDFTSVLGQQRSSIARINADGTLDMGFNPFISGGNPSWVSSVTVQADGKILIAGSFNFVSFITRNNIARINADGTLDMSFNPNLNKSASSVAVQADGKIVIGGSFTTVGGTPRNRIARLDASGALEAGFNPSATTTSPMGIEYTSVNGVAVQADAKVLIGGDFTAVGGTPRRYFARVDASGTLDASFDPNPNSHVGCVVVQADGKILIGGLFTGVGGIGRNNIARINADGTLDMGFNPNLSGSVSSTAFSVTVQADGKILIGGAFETVGGSARNHIARVSASGALDAGFNSFADGGVYSVVIRADGRVLLGGNFQSPRGRFAQLFNDAATQSLRLFDATRLTWTRGGSSPELSLATFEKSMDGGATWTSLGSGTRIGTAPDWQLTGLALSGNGLLRARGRTVDGSSLIEQVAAFTAPYGPVQQWKLTHLGDANAPDLGDPDGDGVVTLAEYGINTLPQTANAAPHPASRFTYAEGERLRLFLQRDPSHNDVTVIAESTDSLAGPWSALATSTLGAPFTGPGYVSGDDATPGVKTVEIRDTVNITAAAGRFMRVRVVRP